MSYPTFVTTPDGAKLAYDVLGSQHLGHSQPIVLVAGMSVTRGDWAILSSALSQKRPVLIYDHRGIGDSTLANPENDKEMTLEVLARDLMLLISYLGWMEVAICGFSMGGVITQQLLLLPYLPQNSTPLPFRVTHALLVATCSSPLDSRYGLKFPRPPPGIPTPEQKKELMRSVVESTLDPVWLGDKKNEQRFAWLLDRAIYGRPPRTIFMQGAAVRNFDFADLHAKLPKDTQFLVINGKVDAVVPFFYGQEVLKRIPTARSVEVGNRPGQVPNLEFGHLWWEYFDVGVWRDVVEVFLGNADGAPV